jgi:phosphatidylserine synthase
VYERPRQVKWFIGLQIFAAALGGVLAVAVRNDIGWQIGLPHLAFVLLAYLAVKSFVVWKTWKGKNWARLIVFAWFLYTYISYFAQLRSGATPIQIGSSLKVLTFVVAVLQVTSLALLFTRPANEWFRSLRSKQGMLLPR